MVPEIRLEYDTFEREHERRVGEVVVSLVH